MDERLQQDPIRMTSEEAEAVIDRFREQEEAFAKEMEARATMPTVKDLAEGLNVPRERIEQILQEIRRPVPEPAQKAVPSEEAMAEVDREKRRGLAIGLTIVAVLLCLGIYAVLLMSVAHVEMPAPPAPPAPISDSEAVFADGGSAEDAVPEDDAADAPVPTSQ